MAIDVGLPNLYSGYVGLESVYGGETKTTDLM